MDQKEPGNQVACIIYDTLMYFAEAVLVIWRSRASFCGLALLPICLLTAPLLSSKKKHSFPCKVYRKLQIKRKLKKKYIRSSRLDHRWHKGNINWWVRIIMDLNLYANYDSISNLKKMIKLMILNSWPIIWQFHFSLCPHFRHVYILSLTML